MNWLLGHIATNHSHVLENISEDYLEGSHSNYRGEKTRDEHLASFHWREAFHVSQLEPLRAFIESKR